MNYLCLLAIRRILLFDILIVKSVIASFVVKYTLRKLTEK